MNPIDKIAVDGLIESATPEYIALVERDERVWREAKRAELRARYEEDPNFSYVDEDGVVTQVVSLEFFRRMKASVNTSLRLAVGDSMHQRKIAKRWRRAAMWGWGLLLVGVAIWGMCSR